MGRRGGEGLPDAGALAHERTYGLREGLEVLLAGRLCEIVIFDKSKRCEPGDEESLAAFLDEKLWHLPLAHLPPGCVSWGAVCDE